MLFVLVLVVAVSAFVLGYCVGGADADDGLDDETLRTLRRMHERGEL